MGLRALWISNLLHYLLIEVQPQHLPMKWVFWNVRGVNKRYKQKELKAYLQTNKISVAGLIETRVNEHNMTATLRGIAPGWGIMHNYNAAVYGRIWVIWDENWYENNIIRCTAQIVHCMIKDRTKGHQIVLTVIYGYNTIEQRKELWLELNTLAQGIAQPWLIAGIFNALLTPQDRLAGAKVSLNEMKDFAECVKDIDVTELQWMEHYYSWTNKQNGTDRISNRIDKFFGNYEWMEK
uniref:Endonuclease/exonuclease/phosphatase n=1 Tax=Solanum tuberosum TaxID=4113 RepID=M1B958_SOLTU